MPVLSYCSHSLFLSGMFLHHSFFSIPVSVCLPHSAAAATCSHPDLQVHTHAQLRLSHYTHCGDVAAGWFVSWEKRRYLSWSASCLWSCTTSRQYLHLLRIVLIYIYIFFFYRIQYHVLRNSCLIKPLFTLYSSQIFVPSLRMVLLFILVVLGACCPNLLCGLFSAVKSLFMRVSDMFALSVFVGHKYVFHVCVIKKCKQSHEEKKRTGSGQLWEVCDIIHTRAAGSETSPAVWSDFSEGDTLFLFIWLSSIPPLCSLKDRFL